MNTTHWVYIHGEDDRLANAVMMILQRTLVAADFLETWLKSFTEPEKSWDGAYTNASQSKAFYNSRNFLRSLSEAIRTTEEMPQKETITQLVYEALDNLKPY